MALFAPLGFCIGVLARNRGRVTALVFSIVPLAVFYFSDFLSAELMQTADVPLLAWLPGVVIAGLGAPFCWKLLRL